MATQEEPTLQGWRPTIGDDTTLDRVIDEAFRYRGDITLIKADGTTMSGYVSNRNAHAATPYLEMLREADERPQRIPYDEVVSVSFTGKDTAAGQSYEAWKRRREAAQAGD